MGYARWAAIRMTVVLLGTAILLAGCAGRIEWDNAGVTQAERERDENACLRAAIGIDGRSGLLVPYCIDPLRPALPPR